VRPQPTADLADLAGHEKFQTLIIGSNQACNRQLPRYLVRLAMSMT
jgi:hypothetical protein